MALRLTAGPQEIDEFQLSLGMLMHDCSQSNIQRGKTWIFNHCSSPAHYEVLCRFVIALSRSRPIFEDKLHLIYLINDVLFHSERRQELWVKEALHPHLLALLRAAFHFIDANEKQQEKVLKIISIWGDKHYFDETKINALKSGVMVPPPPPGGPPPVSYSGISPVQHSFGHMRYQNPQTFYEQSAPPPPGIFTGPHSSVQPIISPNAHIPTPAAHSHSRSTSEPGPPGISGQFPPGPSPPVMSPQGIVSRSNVSVTPPLPAPQQEKKYHELPAGLMVPAVLPEDAPYTPIRSSSIRLPPHRLPPTTELLDAVDKFYEGLKLIESTGEEDDESVVPENDKIILDKDGWENGFLDDFYKDLYVRRAAAAARAAAGRYQNRSTYHRKRDDLGRRWSRGISYSRSRTRSRSSSRSRSRRNRRHHSYSDSSSISRSRSRGRKRHRRSSRSRTRSESRRRYKSRSRSRHGWRRSTRTRSRSISPSSSFSLSRSRSRSRTKTSSRSRALKSKKARFRSRSSSKSSYISGSRSRSRSRSYRSRSRSYSRDRRKSSEYSSSSRRKYRSRSYSRSRSRTPSYDGGGLGFTKGREEGARPDKMISDRNVGFQMLKKLGWEGAGTGLGSSAIGIAEPIKGGEVRLGEQKYLGVGHNNGDDDDDIFDKYRKAKSYTYQRSDVSSKDKKPAGCFRCGKPGHIARECPD